MLAFTYVCTYREHLYRFRKETDSNDYLSNDTDNDLLLRSLIQVIVEVHCFCATGIICSTSHELLTTQGFTSKTTDAFSASSLNTTLGNILVHNVKKGVNKIDSTFTKNHLKDVLYLGRFVLTLQALLFAINIAISLFSITQIVFCLITMGTKHLGL